MYAINIAHYHHRDRVLLGDTSHQGRLSGCVDLVAMQIIFPSGYIILR